MTQKAVNERADEIMKHYGDIEIENLLNDTENNTLKLGIWDYGGQEIFYAVHHLFLTRFGVYLLLFDMQNLLDEGQKQKSIDFIDFWLNSIAMHATSESIQDEISDSVDSGSPLFLIGSHKDIVSGEADHKKISDLLKKTFKSRLSLLNVHENVEDSLLFSYR